MTDWYFQSYVRTPFNLQALLSISINSTHCKLKKKESRLSVLGAQGAAHLKFLKEPLKGIKILFCGHGLRFFSPLRETNTETTHYLLTYFFSAQCPKRYCRLKLLKGRTSTHPVYMGVRPGLVVHVQYILASILCMA